MGLGDEVLSAQANYTCGIWAANCPVDTLPYEEAYTPPTVQNKMPSRDQLRLLWAGSGLPFLPPLELLAQECGLGRPVAGRLARQGWGDRRGGPCQVSVLSPLTLDQLGIVTT